MQPPVSYPNLRALFERLDQVSATGYECDHTFALTRQFMDERGISADVLLPWLQRSGAGCDCEVMLNVAQQWEGIVGYDTGGSDA